MQRAVTPMIEILLKQFSMKKDSPHGVSGGGGGNQNSPSQSVKKPMHGLFDARAADAGAVRDETRSGKPKGNKHL